VELTPTLPGMVSFVLGLDVPRWGGVTIPVSPAAQGAGQRQSVLSQTADSLKVGPTRVWALRLNLTGVAALSLAAVGLLRGGQTLGQPRRWMGARSHGDLAERGDVSGRRDYRGETLAAYVASVQNQAGMAGWGGQTAATTGLALRALTDPASTGNGGLLVTNLCNMLGIRQELSGLTAWELPGCVCICLSVGWRTWGRLVLGCRE
jgi:hypothetical protein